MSKLGGASYTSQTRIVSWVQIPPKLQSPDFSQVEVEKLVGVGIVFDQPNEYKDEYSVMVQDDVLEVFKQDIPF
jgi:hypothetical protein